MQSGAEEELRSGLRVVPDRRAAIRRAIEIARTGTASFAGKGHERSMTASGSEPWDERVEAEAAIREKLGLTA